MAFHTVTPQQFGLVAAVLLVGALLVFVVAAQPLALELVEILEQKLAVAVESVGLLERAFAYSVAVALDPLG